MKIAFFIQSLEGGGAERVVCNLANYLVNHSHDVTIMTMCDHGIAYHIDSRVRVENIDITTTFYLKPLRALRFIKKLRKSDVCVSFLSSPILITLILKPVIGAKLICTERNYPPSRYGERLQRRLRSWAGNADAWVFQTEQQREWYGFSVEDKKSFVIPNAINEAFLNVKKSEGERKKELVTVGSLQDKKNHKLLIDAFAKVAPQFPEYRLKIYGEGELKDELLGRCKDLNIKDRVSLLGFAQDIPNKIKDSTLFVLSSNVEGIPNALIEAMALGLPCISTRCAGGGAESLIEDGVNGRLVPINDVEALSGAIMQLLSDDSLRRKLGANAKAISNKLVPKIIYGEWESIIKNVIE